MPLSSLTPVLRLHMDTILMSFSHPLLAIYAAKDWWNSIKCRCVVCFANTMDCPIFAHTRRDYDVIWNDDFVVLTNIPPNWNPSHIQSLHVLRANASTILQYLILFWPHAYVSISSCQLFLIKFRIKANGFIFLPIFKFHFNFTWLNSKAMAFLIKFHVRTPLITPAKHGMSSKLEKHGMHSEIKLFGKWYLIYSQVYKKCRFLFYTSYFNIVGEFLFVERFWINEISDKLIIYIYTSTF